jgi:hypothetical protein
MADNIQEEPLDDPKRNQSENQPGEVIPAKETEAISTNQKQKIWKYIITPITTERKIGRVISGNF